MADKLQDGHRDRVRKAYLASSIKNMPEHHILELILFYAIPRKDVKPIAFDMIKKFGSLNNVLNADIDELTQFNGIGENAAVLIKLIGDISKTRGNNDIKRISNSNEAKEYVHSILHDLTVERLVLITLDDRQSIIKSNVLAEGDECSATVDPKKVAECVVRDNAQNVIIAHNHPNAGANPSAEDVNFTIEVLNMLRTMHIHLNDHIIVGQNETKSMSSMLQYANFFDK